MLPVVLLLALWFAANLGVVVASMLKNAPRPRPVKAAPARPRTPVDPRTSTTWTYSHTM